LGTSFSPVAFDFEQSLHQLREVIHTPHEWPGRAG
jgi:hypothetical protein